MIIFDSTIMNKSSANMKRLQRRPQEWGVCHAEGLAVKKAVLRPSLEYTKICRDCKKGINCKCSGRAHVQSSSLEEWYECIKQCIEWSTMDRSGKACNHKVIMKCLYVFIKMCLHKQ